MSHIELDIKINNYFLFGLVVSLVDRLSMGAFEVEGKVGWVCGLFTNHGLKSGCILGI